MKKVIVGSLLSLGALPVFAQTGTAIDLVEVTAQYGHLNTAIVAVGSLILVAAALAIGYKWVKGMLFS